MSCSGISIPSNHKEVVDTLYQYLEWVMYWMSVKELKLIPDKMELLLVGSNLPIGSRSMPMLSSVALTPKLSFHNLGVLLSLSLLLDYQVVTMARGAYRQLR